MPSEIRVIAIEGLPEVAAGSEIGTLAAASAEAQDTPIAPGDVIVIAQKIVSKSEGRLVPADTREEARAAAMKEARRVVRSTPDHLILETHHGLVCANAGVDMSNVAKGTASLLPRDPDASAARIRKELESRCGSPVAVIVADTFGRAWRTGQTNVAIGASGIEAVRRYDGMFDEAGRELLVTEIAHIDELAAAGELVMDKLARVPVAIVRGYAWKSSEQDRASDLVRPPGKDLFR